MAVGLLLTLLIMLGIALINSSADAQRTIRCLLSGYGRIVIRILCANSMSLAIGEHQRQTARLPIMQSTTLPRKTPKRLGRVRNEIFRRGPGLC